MTATVDAVSDTPFWQRIFAGSRGATRTAFYEELASLLDAGLGMRAAMTSMRGRGATSELIGPLVGAVAAGRPLHEGAAGHPRVFRPFETAMLRAGEQGGRLSAALRALANHNERVRRARENLLRRLAYPALVLHVALFLPTIPLVLVPHGFGSWLLLVIVGLALIWGVPLALMRFHAMRRDDPGHSRRVCGLPVIGPALRDDSIARFAWAFGALHDAGMSPRETLEGATSAAGLGWLTDDLRTADERLAGGNSFHDALHDRTSIPDDVRAWIGTGEESGTLSEALERAGVIYAERAERASSRAAVFAGGIAFSLAVIIVVALAFNVIGGYYGAVYDLTR